MFSARPLVVVAMSCASAAFGQTIAPQYESNYTIQSLGSVPGVPPSYGGLAISPTDNNLLLIGGAANNTFAAVYSIRVTRDQCGSIIGFDGTAVQVASAPQIDGGLLVTTDGVILTSRYPDNGINMIEPGSTSPDKVVFLSGLGVVGSTGSIVIVPPGQPGAGRLKILSYSSGIFYDSTLVPDGMGTYNVTGVNSGVFVGGGPEGAAYVPAGSPLFAAPAVLIAEYGTGSVSAWDVDANGDPILGTRRLFASSLTGAEGAYIDPSSGDFIFSSFGGGNAVYVVRGFAEVITCDSIDFNGDGLFPDNQDLEDFFSVFGGGPCSTGTCSDIDFNNDCLFPDNSDLEAFLNVFGGGPC
ncbi:MAG TPA: hypothetical protein VD971_05370 [Phycisphaerales bacterium]|nr:hypothetical protein [Phycisphaerales bacterium]